MKNWRTYIYLSCAIFAFIGCKEQNVQSSDMIELSSNWQMVSNSSISLSGEELSSQESDKTPWLQINTPSTVLTGLISAGIYENVYYADELKKIDTKQFEQPWWYKTKFDVKANATNHTLVFEGINYRANIWLNGKKIADKNDVEGPFGIWSFDVSHLIQPTKNRLTVQIFPPESSDLTIGFVDWNPRAPDENMGIWRPVKLYSHGKVSMMGEPFVSSSIDFENQNRASLTIKTDVKNHSEKDQDITLQFSMNGIEVHKEFKIAGLTSKTLVLDGNEFKQLNIQNPKLWWPNQMGEPHLYNAEASLSIDNEISDKKVFRFGIRQVDEYINKEGHRGYKINGHETLIRGAGWVDDLLLADPDHKVRSQMEYVKHMNLNCVRLEGFWGRNKTLYEAADELGILLMIGWSCHWEWEGYCHRYDDDYMAIRSEEDQELQARAYQDQVRWLRNHPSVFLWVYGSDKLPLPELETKLNSYVNAVDGTRPILSSCKYEDFDIVRDHQGTIVEGYINNSEVSGPTLVKMLGPYGYTAPNYWYLDKRAGGAYGFNTETGPGAQIPPIESIKKMIPQENLWPIDEMWDYHSGRNEFSTIDRDKEAIEKRYGTAQSAKEFTQLAQLSNYEAMRAMYEAFIINRPSTTGIVQWMLNSAWPEMFWQLYDWYLMPNGAFYGAKTANQPIVPVYNYADKTIHIGNTTLKTFKNHHLRIRVYDIKSKLYFDETIELNIEKNSAAKIIKLPEFENISTSYFLDLRIEDDQNENIARNFYWLSTVSDVHDWDNSEWFFTPYQSYADLTELRDMPRAKLSYTFNKTILQNNEIEVVFNIENKTDKISFFNELSIKNKATGETILPVFWDDNYISLLPGEEREIKAIVNKNNALNTDFEYSVNGINIK